MPSSEFYTGESLLNGKDFSYRQLYEFFLLTLTLNYTVSLSKAIPISNMYALHYWMCMFLKCYTLLSNIYTMQKIVWLT